MDIDDYEFEENQTEKDDLIEYIINNMIENDNIIINNIENNNNNNNIENNNGLNSQEKEEKSDEDLFEIKEKGFDQVLQEEEEEIIKKKKAEEFIKQQTIIEKKLSEKEEKEKGISDKDIPFSKYENFELYLNNILNSQNDINYYLNKGLNEIHNYALSNNNETFEIKSFEEIIIDILQIMKGEKKEKDFTVFKDQIFINYEISDSSSSINKELEQKKISELVELFQSNIKRNISSNVSMLQTLAFSKEDTKKQEYMNQIISELSLQKKEYDKDFKTLEIFDKELGMKYVIPNCKKVNIKIPYIKKSGDTLEIKGVFSFELMSIPMTIISVSENSITHFIEFQKFKKSSVNDIYVEEYQNMFEISSTFNTYFRETEKKLFSNSTKKDLCYENYSTTLLTIINGKNYSFTRKYKSWWDIDNLLLKNQSNDFLKNLLNQYKENENNINIKKTPFDEREKILEKDISLLMEQEEKEIEKLNEEHHFNVSSIPLYDQISDYIKKGTAVFDMLENKEKYLSLKRINKNTDAFLITNLRILNDQNIQYTPVISDIHNFYENYDNNNKKYNKYLKYYNNKSKLIDLMQILQLSELKEKELKTLNNEKKRTLKNNIILQKELTTQINNYVDTSSKLSKSNLTPYIIIKRILVPITSSMKFGDDYLVGNPFTEEYFEKFWKSFHENLKYNRQPCYFNSLEFGNSLIYREERKQDNQYYNDLFNLFKGKELTMMITNTQEILSAQFENLKKSSKLQLFNIPLDSFHIINQENFMINNLKYINNFNNNHSSSSFINLLLKKQMFYLMNKTDKNTEKKEIKISYQEEREEGGEEKGKEDEEGIMEKRIVEEEEQQKEEEKNDQDKFIKEQATFSSSLQLFSEYNETLKGISLNYLQKLKEDNCTSSPLFSLLCEKYEKRINTTQEKIKNHFHDGSFVHPTKEQIKKFTFIAQKEKEKNEMKQKNFLSNFKQFNKSVFLQKKNLKGKKAKSSKKEASSSEKTSFFSKGKKTVFSKGKTVSNKIPGVFDKPLQTDVFDKKRLNDVTQNSSNIKKRKEEQEQKEREQEEQEKIEQQNIDLVEEEDNVKSHINKYEYPKIDTTPSFFSLPTLPSFNPKTFTELNNLCDQIIEILSDQKNIIFQNYQEQLNKIVLDNKEEKGKEMDNLNKSFMIINDIINKLINYYNELKTY